MWQESEIILPNWHLTIPYNHLIMLIRIEALKETWQNKKWVQSCYTQISLVAALSQPFLQIHPQIQYRLGGGGGEGT